MVQMILLPAKIFSTVTTLQRCRGEYLKANIFLSSDKILCFLTAVLHWVI